MLFRSCAPRRRGPSCRAVSPPPAPTPTTPTPPETQRDSQRVTGKAKTEEIGKRFPRDRRTDLAVVAVGDGEPRHPHSLVAHDELQVEVSRLGDEAVADRDLRRRRRRGAALGKPDLGSQIRGVVVANSPSTARPRRHRISSTRMVARRFVVPPGERETAAWQEGRRGK